MPVFISGVDPNETFNAGHGITDCDSICYNASSRTKLWGLVTSAVYWKALYNLPNSIRQLDQSHRFNLLAVVGNGTAQSIANSTRGSSIGGVADYSNCDVCAGFPQNPVSASIAIYNQIWTLQVRPGFKG